MICRHFKTCGGCTFQHLSYEEELQKKEASVKELFSFVEAPFLPIIGSQNAFGYRNKMEFTFRQSLKNEKFLGLLQKKGRVTLLHECLISPSWFIEVLQKVYRFWDQSKLDAYYPPKNLGTLRTLTLREGLNTSEKMIILTISDDGLFSIDDEERFLRTLLPLSDKDVVVLRRQIVKKNMPTQFDEKILFGKGYIQEILHDRRQKPFIFKIKPASFFQPNTKSAEILYQKGIELAAFSSDEIVFDLYCGTGTIGIFLSPYVKQVYGIESEPSSVQDGLENIQSNSIHNVEIIKSSIEDFCPSFSPTSVVIDPPRTGLTVKAMQKILSLSPKKILYISCNPVTQSQNIKDFIDNGYTVAVIQPIDQFPKTRHVENIVVLFR